MHKFFILIHLLHSSTCFEHYCAHRDKIERNEMGGTCGMHGGEEMCIRGFGRET